MSSPFMPFYVADHLADTMRLTTLEQGAYILLISEYWRTGHLPSDDKRLARIVRMTVPEWAEIRDVIAEFFQPGWRHKRVDAELSKAAAKSEAARASAGVRWQNKGLAKRSYSEGSCERIADAMLSESETESDRSWATPKSERTRPRSRLSARTPIDADAPLSDAYRKVATVEYGMSDDRAEFEWRHHCTQHAATGSFRADWLASWRSWLIRDMKGTFDPKSAGPVFADDLPPQTTTDVVLGDEPF